MHRIFSPSRFNSAKLTTVEINTFFVPLSLSDDLVSELSSKSGTPSPAVHHRDLRESSVASRSSLETNDTNSEFDFGGGGGMREERFPSPFNKQGSLSSLGVSGC